MSSLEHRYRRLVSLYPAAHRQRFGEELIGTLMEGADPKQRFPRARELTDLIWSAAWLRFTRQSIPSARDPRWTDAAAVGGLLAPALLIAYYAHSYTGGFAMRLSFGLVPLPWWLIAPVAWWLVTLVMATSGARVAAALMAWLGALAPLGYFGWLYFVISPIVLPRQWYGIVLSFTAALCLTVRFPARRGIHVLGRPFATVLLAAFALTALAPSIQLALWPQDSYAGYIVLPLLMEVEYFGPVSLASFAFLVIVLARLLIKARPWLRRRLLAIAAPAAAMPLLISVGYEGFIQSSMRFHGQLMMTAGQWGGLILVPPLIFLLGLVLVHRGDQREELIELGKAELARQKVL
jgi:hypothetical protein